MGFVQVEQQTHAAVHFLAKIAFISVQFTETSSAVAALSNGRPSAGITICIVHASNHHDLAAHSACRLAEVAIISSAQRTASAIALTVAGTRVPPSYGISFLAARMLAAINSTRFLPSSIPASYHLRYLFANVSRATLIVRQSEDGRIAKLQLGLRSYQHMMNLQDAIEKAGQILDEERIEPTVDYKISPVITDPLAIYTSLMERGQRPLRVRENPQEFQFKSGNFDLLCALSDQVPEADRPALFEALSSRILVARSYRHRSKEVLGAGAWARCSSELPLLAELLVRRGDKQLFIRALSEAPPTPGLTLMLRQLEEMIALNLTLFTDGEYTQLPRAIEGIRRKITDLNASPKPSSTIESNIVYNVCCEVPELCNSVSEACRKAKFLYLKGSLLPGMNLEVNQDKNRVQTFLEKLGFAPLLIESLDEAERLYQTAATPFELKSSMGHLRSFVEQLHLEACAALHKNVGGTLPSKWGEALQYLRDRDVLTVKEQQFAIHFYALVSDTSVHPLVAEREYARLIRNMSIEYGLLLLTKLDKLRLN